MDHSHNNSCTNLNELAIQFDKDNICYNYLSLLSALPLYTGETAWLCE